MELTFNVLLGTLSLYTGIHILVIRWLKNQVDKERVERINLVTKVREDHISLDRLIAKEYMDTTRTMEMYGMMTKHTEERMSDIIKKIDKMDQKLDTIILER